MPQKSFPSHDEMADYLEDYVRHFGCRYAPVRKFSDAPQRTWFPDLDADR